MKKLFIAAFAAMTMVATAASAGSKPDLNVVMAGSPGGTFNSFNKELVKDLEQYYNVTKLPGQSELKGNKLFHSIDDEATYVMTKTGFHNARTQSEGKETFHPNLQSDFMVMSISYYKAICVAGGKDVDDVFKSGGNMKIGLTEGVGPSNKYVDNLNRVTGSNHVMVPYRSSGKTSAAVITGELDAVLINEAKALKFMKTGQLACKYTQNPDGGNGMLSLKDKVNDDWFGWKYSHYLIGHVKNVDAAFAKQLYETILAIYRDPNSNSFKKLKANGWYGETLSQSDIFARYQGSFKDTAELLK